MSGPGSPASLLGASKSTAMSASFTSRQTGCFPSAAGGRDGRNLRQGESPKQKQRRLSQSLLGLEFRLKLVLNTLGLEKQAYQFAVLGCTRAQDVQFLRFVDLKGVSMVQFRRLQAMCDAGSGADDSSDATSSDEEGG